MKGDGVNAYVSTLCLWILILSSFALETVAVRWSAEPGGNCLDAMWEGKDVCTGKGPQGWDVTAEHQGWD